MHELTAEAVAGAMERKGYKVFRQEPDDLNLFGIRTAADDANSFNDHVGVMYRFQGAWVLCAFPATTDPGVYWRERPMNVEGTAILKPGQYRGAYRVGRHKGYPALQQDKPVTIWRDDDRDAALDEGGLEQTGMFGINIHRANSARASSQVDRWSAGCQVVADPLHFDFLMSIARRAAQRWGNAFTYTLLTTDDLEELDMRAGGP